MLALRCSLLRATYEADRADAPGVAEWPPHWMRLYSALVSVAERDESEEAVLHELESVPPPEVRASPPAEVLETRRSAFVPTNATATPAHSTLPARKNATRAWTRVAPSQPVVFFVWPELQLTASQRAALARLCRRVPYLGRTTSPVLVDVAEPDDMRDLGWSLEPRGADRPDRRFVSEEVMRVPYPGALAELRRAHEDKYLRGLPGDPWAVGEWVEYGHEELVSDELAVRRGPLGDMAVLAIEGRALDGRLAARITTELRRAVRARAERDIPAIHGHHAGDQPQVCFVALPFVGAEHADGHILGLGIMFPRALERSDAATVAAALPAEAHTMELTCGALGVLVLRRVAPLDLQRLVWGLRAERWRGPATRWCTAYPIVFDRYLKRRDDPEEELRRTVERSRYPAPTEVQLSRYPLISGALDLAPIDTVRRKGEQGYKPYRHAILDFEAPLEGPVVIGSMRHYGLGLCVPLGDHAETGKRAMSGD
jgi:CRISPR-associated protein Csb2